MMLCRPPDEIPRAFYENSGGKEKEALGSNGVMADLNIGLKIPFCLFANHSLSEEYELLSSSSHSVIPSQAIKNLLCMISYLIFVKYQDFTFV